MRRIIEVMSRREAAASRRPELREMKCVIIEPPGSGNEPYWKPRMHGYTPDLEQAGLYSLPEALTATSSGGGQSVGFIQEGEPEPGPDGKPRRRSCKLILGSSLYAMLGASPGNPTVRAHVMARIGRMPPDELDTLQKIEDWIECDTDCIPGDKPADVVAVAPPSEAFIVMTRNSEMEIGSCRYRQTNTSQSAVPVTREMIEAALADNEDDFDSVVDEISDYIKDHAYEHEHDHNSSTPEHDDYDCGETQDREIELSRRDLSNQIASYLRGNLTREQLEELGL